MAFKIKKPTKQAVALIRRSLVKLHRPGRRVTKRADELIIAAPHKRYTITLENVLKGNLDRASFSGWRFLILDGMKAIATANLRIDRRSRKPLFSHFGYGSFVQNTVKGIRRAERLDDSDYELRLLTIPGLNIVALWLRGKKEDQLIPLPPTHRALKPFSIQSPVEFFECIKTAAKARLESENNSPFSSS